MKKKILREGWEHTGPMMDSRGKDNVSGNSSCEDPNPCPICLGPVLLESYLDQCFHKFCYDCILRWTKVLASKHDSLSSTIKCPLCKTENFSIVHGYDGSSFQQHYINHDIGKCFCFSKAHKYRLQCYYTEPGILNDKFNVSRYWKLHKYRQPNPQLQPWLRREIQALIQEEDVDIIVHHILGMLDSIIKRNEQKHQTSTPERKQEEFKASISDAARPFLTGRTDRFVNEVELFLASGLNIEAYDEVYLQQLGWTNRRAATERVEQNGHTQVVPYLYLFDYESDGID